MTLNEFLIKNKINISTAIKLFCDDGLAIMANTKDPSHDITHIERIFNFLDKFINENSDISFDIPVLLCAVCWHDVWKAKRYSKNAIKIMYDLVSEGTKSAKLTRAEMKKRAFPKEFINKVVYCIRKHSVLQFRSRKSEEAKILKDLDTLDMYDVSRLLAINFEKNKGLKMLLSRSKRIAHSKRLGRYHFAWSKKRA